MLAKYLAPLTFVAALLAALPGTPALGDEPRAGAAPAPDDVPPPTVPVPVPPERGSKEDRDLWIAGTSIASRIGLVRLEANKMQWDARAARTLLRLEEASKAEGEPGRKAAALLERYRKAIAHNHHTMTRQWPVDPTRGCGYPAQVFHSAVEADGKARSERALTRSREDLADCVAKAEPAIQVMATSNEEMRKLTAEVEALLGPPAGAVPGAAARREGGAEASGAGRPD